LLSTISCNSSGVQLKSAIFASPQDSDITFVFGLFDNHSNKGGACTPLYGVCYDILMDTINRLIRLEILCDAG